MTQFDLESQWITPAGVPGVNYRFSDLVVIKTGKYSGQTAEVISLIGLDPEPTYVVVLPLDEKSAVLPQSELDPTGSSRGRTLKLFPPGQLPAIKRPT